MFFSFLSLRAQYAPGDDDIPFNQLHGTDSEVETTKEVEFFFPTQQTIAVVKPNALSEKGKSLKRLQWLLISILSMTLLFQRIL